MTNEWGIERLDLAAYLDRIGQPAGDVSVETLQRMHAAHVRAIPFENVDVVLGTHQGLELDVVQAKLVGRQRGGYCYEHALLLAAVLETLGFEVERRVARVQPHKSGPKTHMNLLVRVNGEQWLADVGFGAGILHPMPLKDGAVVDQGGWEHRLTDDGGTWTLAKKTGDDWVPQHASNDEPQRLIDYEVYHHYVATHPHSPFSAKLVVMRLADGVSRRVVGTELTTEYADGRTEHRTLTADDLGPALAALDVVLNDEELDRLLLKASRF
ncbi:arylamine N-acetyltransferase family protein [Kribbella italica]|uniref:N-hydroxyarylamine O-acetyltransferase n=1 Tax=Kribbella italica TaxID=1540520 RepID=A0A7W9JEF0_9ACTN|nr:arylamine N-acetyltransferase [Kribbella italica]MBB5840220.1 N-hydroxyarylamine O-acetyltransferase [Kribbella italica]